MISKPDMQFIEAHPSRLFDTEVGKKISREAMEYLAHAARAASTATKVPELRDLIDPAIARDIVAQSYQLFGRASIITMLYTMLADEDFEPCYDKVKMLICMTLLKAFDDEDALRRLVKSTIEYYAPNFEREAKDALH